MLSLSFRVDRGVSYVRFLSFRVDRGVSYELIEFSHVETGAKVAHLAGLHAVLSEHVHHAMRPYRAHALLAGVSRFVRCLLCFVGA